MSRPSRYSAIRPAERLPAWIRSPLGAASSLEAVQAVVKGQRLHTICEEGRCPNRGECYAAGTATFLLGGPICTRSCAVCQVEKGKGRAPGDAPEAERGGGAGVNLGGRYVVV
ncbi:MAG: lipoyl synthase, partial [Cyanobacteriota bacterium]